MEVNGQLHDPAALWGLSMTKPTARIGQETERELGLT